jgi:hypothetical protein
MTHDDAAAVDLHGTHLPLSQVGRGEDSAKDE